MWKRDVNWKPHPDEVRRVRDRLLAEKCRRSLLDFWNVMWSVLEPGREFKKGWALEAMCDILQAVHYGHVKDVIINEPPGMGKSWLLAAFTAWEWGPRGMPWLRYVTTSYAHNVVKRDNKRVRAMINSPAFQACFGHGGIELGLRVAPGTPNPEDKPEACLSLRGQQSIELVENASKGFRIALSIGGQVMGQRGDRTLLDDPNRTDRADSLAELEKALQFATEVLPTRVNDASESAHVLIQQRTHNLDVSGHKLRHKLYDAHLCLPMRFDVERKCVISVPNPDPEDERPLFYWEDPRTEPGELLFPELFPEPAVCKLEKALSSWGGSFAVKGQLEQNPQARGGGMFQKKWFAAVPKWELPVGGRVVRGWDLAASEEAQAPYTAGVRLRKHTSGLIIVENAVQRQLTHGARDEWMRRIAEADGPGVQQDFPQDPGQAGKTQRAALASGPFEGFNSTSSVESGAKELRAIPFASQAENGNVVLEQGPWNELYLNALEDFLKSKRSDLVDATSRAYANLVRRKKLSGVVGPTAVEQE